ncbi:doublecortin domain-containing protein 2 isoform X4 [Thunnus maccoyii]|uniref:doublecortin domain-containing protein 2 isoform X4 n=1 Tax=Thunnus maccoyii TaxID=8240 RepID=UPI001C4C5685|nr:doublecortin domain-containing protein 2 isoform X4 [Thunnus maccoyii]
MPGTLGRGDLPPTKTIIVYRNGDAFFPGRKIVVNPRQVVTFDNFMTSLTRGIEAPFGAVRKLYTPRQGHRVQHLDDLTHGGVYVAAGNEQFKKLDYCEITAKKPQNKKKEQIRPVVHSRIVVSARWRRTTDESCTINVFTNGEVLVPPARIRIPKYTLRSWENVLAMVTEKVCLRTGAVQRLCTFNGHALCGPTELENNQHYVAVGAEKFKALPYDQWVPSRDLSRENHMIEGQDFLPAIRKTRHAKAAFAHTGFGEDLEHTARGQMKKHTAKSERTKQQRQVSRNPVLFPAGECSVFNAQNKRSETAGATEVQEDGQLKVDLPIDQIEAKIVDEEYEDRGCSASPCKASLHDSDGLCLQRSLSGGSRKNCSLSSGQAESVKGRGCNTGDTESKTPEPQEAKEREVSSRLCKLRSRMFWFFKVAADLTVKTPRQRTSSIWHSQLLLFPPGLGITHLKHPPGTNLDNGPIQTAD